MRHITGIFICLLVAQLSFGQLYFRNLKWDMKPEEVKNVEGKAPAKEEGDKLEFEDIEHQGFKGNVEYQFTNGKLSKAEYHHKEHHTVRSIYIQNYDELKAKLKEKYGEPSKDGQKWDPKSPYQELYNQWGQALAEGDVEYYTVWDTDDTHVKMKMTGGNYQVKLKITFTNKKAEEEREEGKEESKDKKDDKKKKKKKK